MEQQPSPSMSVAGPPSVGYRQLVVAIALGVLAIALHACSLGPWEQWRRASAVELLAAGASFAIGALFGFLFGVPRAGVARGAVEPTGELHAEASKQASGGYRANTNLEEVSDWLTKIIVGVGLTQLGEIRSELVRVSKFVGAGIAGRDSHMLGSAAAMAGVLIVYFAVVGFFVGFLWARLELPRAFYNADVQALGQVIEGVKKTVRGMQKQPDLDARALELVEQQLNLDSPEVIDPAALDECIKNASAPAQWAIFSRAASVRTNTWRDERRKPLMERTVPIFSALTDAENLGKSTHRVWGQLGYALKDKRKPDFARALAALDNAITMRGDWRQQGWTYYELNRAICRIELDASFHAGERSSQEARDKVIADLRAVYQSGLRANLPAQLEPITSWMLLNAVQEQDLR